MLDRLCEDITYKSKKVKPNFKLAVCMDDRMRIGAPWEMGYKNRIINKLIRGVGGNVVIYCENIYQIMRNPIYNIYNIIVNPTFVFPRHKTTMTFTYDFDSAIGHANMQCPNDIWVIGGHDIFKQSLLSDYLKEVYILTRKKPFSEDIKFPFGTGQPLVKINEETVDSERVKHLLDRKNYKLDMYRQLDESTISLQLGKSV